MPIELTAEEKLKACEEIIGKLGDGVANMFEQLIHGNWVDDHGHKVTMNAAMIALKEQMEATMWFRHSVLGYSKPVSMSEGPIT